jgi:hypothetical protein
MCSRSHRCAGSRATSSRKAAAASRARPSRTYSVVSSAIIPVASRLDPGSSLTRRKASNAPAGEPASAYVALSALKALARSWTVPTRSAWLVARTAARSKASRAQRKSPRRRSAYPRRYHAYRRSGAGGETYSSTILGDCRVPLPGVPAPRGGARQIAEAEMPSRD